MKRVWRKIIQISATFDPDSGTVIVALCEDGSVWRKSPGSPWMEVDPIPQYEGMPPL